MLRWMPTPESAEAFARLVAARARLTEISNDLRVAFADIQGTAAHSEKRKEAERRYGELQVQWDEAFRAFELATEEFSTAVRHVHDEVEARHAREDREKGFHT
jgi:uncharacterized protein YukE